jgi:pilus assembly protein Flp/PilA
MNTFFSHVKNFIENEEGAIAIEYALLAALIGIALVLAAITLRRNLCGVFAQIGATLANPTVVATFTACAT